MSYLEAHLKTHTKRDETYVCSQCFRRYTDLEEFTEHSMTHRKLPGATCKICGARFDTMGHLMCHMRLHNRGKPNICNICGMGFEKLHEMLEHVKTEHEQNNKYIETVMKPQSTVEYFNTKMKPPSFYQTRINNMTVNVPASSMSKMITNEGPSQPKIKKEH